MPIVKDSDTVCGAQDSWSGQHGSNGSGTEQTEFCKRCRVGPGHVRHVALASTVL